MPIFIKTEKFKAKTLELSKKDRKFFLLMHKKWVESVLESGQIIHSGYLIDEDKIPGGGGLLIIEARNYLTAKKIIQEDPMIKNELVIWKLQEWIPIYRSREELFNHLG
tara:strand:- start:728 stop:1054 length:327 start_codon:yes stop_codon:yes gene_type:complete